VEVMNSGWAKCFTLPKNNGALSGGAMGRAASVGGNSNYELREVKT